MIHAALSWSTAITAIAAAACWIWSARILVLSNNTQGWGALVGGYMVVKGPNGERVDLVETLKGQWVWNTRAATLTGCSALCLALQMAI
jgi:hypothetical protein